MNKTRVLVIDDSVVVRRIVSDVLSADPMLEVVGTAANGEIGVAKIPDVHPDIIILDVEMPVMDGLETLSAIRKVYPRLPVIMFSTLTLRGGVTTLDCLSRGASDYVTKPANVGSVIAAKESLQEQLIPKIKALCPSTSRTPAVTTRPVADVPRVPAPRFSSLNSPAIDVVAIGVSTGGPNALSELLPTFPGNLPVPIVLVQHMPAMFTRLLAERLATKCQLGVHEATAGARLQPGHVYIAPGDFHMVVRRTGVDVELMLNQEPHENSCRPAVDVLFRSVVEVYGPATLGVILTGMGQDGLQGCERIRQAGGQIIVQDEESSVVWGMPGQVFKAGLADKTLPLNQIASEVVSRIQKRRPDFKIVAAPRN